MFRWNRIIPVIFFLNILAGQSISTVDTLLVKIDQYKFALNPFIVDSSFFLFHNGKLVEDYQLNTISGVLDLVQSQSKPGLYLASYRYFIKPIPVQIGPLFESLPLLDSLLIVNSDSVQSELTEIQNDFQDELSNLATTGTVYRNISLSPFGGSDFSAGLQLQLQGKLSNNITVSGVLSDQSLPIQPEGTTQVLDEIDKVYLHINHPIFQVMAGDIDYELRSGKYLNVSRKLEGLKNTFKFEKWTGQSALAGTRGRYHQLSFKGTDGSQGPYSLTSENGNNDIIVLAGSEKVHLNDELLKRGENFDYIIDYSVGEMTFTPRRLINFDSDIYVEYQYSDFQYNRNVLSASVYRDLGEWGKLGISWFKEKDQLEIDETVASGLRDSLLKAGDQDALFSGAVKDEAGDYLLTEGIYIYSPGVETDLENRYKVSFHNNNENGEYARRISNDGHLYFEFIKIEDRTAIVDLYNPFRRWINPIKHEIFQLAGNAKFSKNTIAAWDISLSNLDKNTFSKINDDDNTGLAYNISIEGKDISIFKNALFGYNIINWNRSDRFRELSRERNAQFNRDWNIKSDDIRKESLFSSGFNLKLSKSFNSIFDWSQYNSFLGKKNRMTGKIISNTKYIPKFNSYFNRVQTENSNYYQFNVYGMLLPGSFHPIIGYEGEYEKGDHKFNLGKIGLLFSKENKNVAASITRRIDYKVLDTDSTKMDISQEGLFGELDINGKFTNGWSGKIVFKKRISDNLVKQEKLNYAIGLANIRFSNKTNPLRWELHSKLEETYTEARAIVYDSIGVGLGSYRFDREFNEYISDPNGAYISYTILTGERDLITHFNASQRLLIDFEKLPFNFLKNIDFRSDLKTEFKGTIFTLNMITNPNLSDNDIARSKINLRNEIDYNPKGNTRRIRNWTIFSQDLLGADPRGNDLRLQKEYYLEWREPIKKQFYSVLTIKAHNIDNTSGFSNLRNRNVDGWWTEEEIKWSIEKKWQFGISLLGGKDSGRHNQQFFSAYAYGFKIESQRFISSTSKIKLRTELFNSVESSANSAIPPEALNGLPLGRSISINIQGQILFGKNLSLNVNANYIDNIRYNNFITVSGELRAYF
ncbi:MAG: hypothetical protein V3R52_05320 [Candidatus Neomarinimicrobiota bacterium]